VSACFVVCMTVVLCSVQCEYAGMYVCMCVNLYVIWACYMYVCVCVCVLFVA